MTGFNLDLKTVLTFIKEPLELKLLYKNCAESLLKFANQ